MSILDLFKTKPDGPHVLKYQWSTPEHTPQEMIEMQKHYAAEYLRRIAGNAVQKTSFKYAHRQRKGKTGVWDDHLMAFQFWGKLSPEAAGLKVAHDLKKKTEADGNTYVPPQAPGTVILH